MNRQSVVMFFCLLIFAAPAAARDDMAERIRQLELQIQELKLLKEQQSVAELKYEDCMKAVAREKFCRCVGDSLPREISFEQYVHILVTPAGKPDPAAMTVEQRQSVEAIRAVREKCIEKGFFK